MLDKIKDYRYKSGVIGLLRANSLYSKQIRNDNIDLKKSCIDMENMYQDVFKYMSTGEKLEWSYLLCLAACNYAHVLKILDDGDTERACEFLERAEKLMKYDDMKNQIHEEIKNMRRSTYYVC